MTNPHPLSDSDSAPKSQGLDPKEDDKIRAGAPSSLSTLVCFHIFTQSCNKTDWPTLPELTLKIQKRTDREGKDWQQVNESPY